MMRRLLGPEPSGDGLDGWESLYRSSSPWLRANFVVSLDGAVEFEGRSAPLGGDDDQEVLVALRALADAVMVGAGTLRTEGYGPIRLRADAVARRLERGQAPLPTLVAVSRAGRLDRSLPLFALAGGKDPVPPPPIVVVPRSAEVGDLEERATVLRCGDDAVDLVAAISDLRARGLVRIVCEGGPGLLGDLLAAELVDELCLTHSPTFAGAGRHRLGDSTFSPSGGPVRFSLTGLVESSGLLFGRYGRPSNP